MPKLTKIVFEHGTEEIPSNALMGTFPNTVQVYVPMSVESVAANSGLDTPDKFTIYGVNNTYIYYWAIDKEVPFEAIDSEITKSDYDDAWLLVPYQYIVETNRPGNANLRFVVTGGAILPAGLELLENGSFYGAPSEEALPPGENEKDYKLVIEVYDTATTWGYLLDLQEIQFTVRRPVTNAELETVNAERGYEVEVHVGDEDPVTGEYTLTGFTDELGDQIFEIGDKPEEGSNFQYFTGFWLDGEPLTPYPFDAEPGPDADYKAEKGSTVITAYAETFKDLDKGEHTIAAEFMIPNEDRGMDVQKVAAQKFTLDLTERPATDPDPDPGDDDDKTDPDPGDDDDKTNPDPGDNDDGGTDDGKGGGNDNGNTKPPNETDTPEETPTVPDTGDENGGGDENGNDETPGNTETPGDTTDPEDNEDDEDDETGNDETPGNTETPGDTTDPEDNPASPPGNTDNNETPGNAETPENAETPAGTNPPNNTSSSRDAGSSDGPGAPITVRAGDTAQTAPSGADADANANETAQTAPAAPPDIVTLVGETADAGPAAGGAAGNTNDTAPGGLTREADSSLTYSLDGSGAPFELRVDIAFTEFRGLSFDGVPWEQGTDYTAREGSTILMIAAERLAGFAAGIHRISAVFENETVEIEFLLQTNESAVAVAENGTGATAPASVEDTPAKGPGAGTIAAIALAVILILAAAFMLLRARRRATA